MSLIGLDGTIKMLKYKILMHALLTTGVIGSFCIFTVIEANFLNHEVFIIYLTSKTLIE